MRTRSRGCSMEGFNTVHSDTYLGARPSVMAKSGYSPPFLDWLYVAGTHIVDDGYIASNYVPTEVITDELSPVGTKRKNRRFLPCTHTRAYGSNCEVEYVLRSREKSREIPSDPLEYTYVMKGTHSFAPPSTANVVVNILSENAILAFEDRAITAMTPKLTSGVSLVNSLIELKDFKKLALLIAQGASTIGAFASRWVTKQNCTKTMAELALFDQMALEPTLRDIFNVHQALQNLGLALERFGERGKRVSTYHYSEMIPLSSNWGTYGATQAFWARRVELRASMKARYTVNHDGTALSDLIEYFGLTITPRAIWNAIPFSWVVDSLFNIGKALEQFDESISVNLEISDWCITMVSNVDQVTAFNPENTQTGYVVEHFKLSGDPVHPYGFTPAGGFKVVASSTVERYSRMVRPTPQGIRLPSIPPITRPRFWTVSMVSSIVWCQALPDYDPRKAKYSKMDLVYRARRQKRFDRHFRKKLRVYRK